MPDDVVAPEETGMEVAEHQEEQDGLDAFEQAVSEEEDGKAPLEEKEDDKAAEGEEVKPGDEAEDEGEVKGEVKAEAEPEEKEQTAVERAEERGKEIEKDLGIVPEGDEAKTPAAAPAAEPAKVPAAAPANFSKEHVANLLGAINKDDLPGEIIVGDEAINLKEFAEEWPEQFAASKVLAGVVASEAIKGVVEKYEANAVDPATVTTLQNKIHNLEFWGEVIETHPDGKALNIDPKFIDWLADVAPRAVRTLAKHLREPRDAIDILDAYKESIAKEAVTKHDKELAEKKGKVVNLHKGTLRTKKAEVASSDPDNFDPAKEFDKAAEEEDRLDEK